MTVQTPKPTSGTGSVAKAWMRAIELTTPIAQNRGRIFPTTLEELAGWRSGAFALLSDREDLTYRALVERSNQYARWALRQGLAKGDAVCLLMPNRPEYMAIWIGITKVGGVVALLNTNLTGASLAHCINIAAPKHIIVDTNLVSSLETTLPKITEAAVIWVHGASRSQHRRIDHEVGAQPSDALTANECRPVTINDRALYIYTSGTTGLPKAVIVSHGRIMQWSLWFAGMMDSQPTDRMYDCLPMYHSVGGVLAPGAVLVMGGSVVIRESFSASQFWRDISRWDCTLLQYIGELCRYLLHTPPSPHDTAHRIRLACGNGLRSDVWKDFQDRFKISRIFEFYAATEGGVSLFNLEGERGAIGRVPSYLTQRFSPTLVSFDVEKGEPVRGGRGFCVPCSPNEVGEAIGQVLNDSSNVGSRFEGYTSGEASEKKLLRNVFRSGDIWIRTGDLMRKDERGFFYFVDRIGDTFRWKGENVSTSEVSGIICAFPGVKEANVYGVELPGTDGRVGMAVLVADAAFDLSDFRTYLANCLPRYARPLFLRIREDIEITGTFKYTKTHVARQAYNPAQTTDALYFDHPERQAFVRVSEELYADIKKGAIRL